MIPSFLAFATDAYARVLDADCGQFEEVALNRSDEPQQVTIPVMEVSSRFVNFADGLGGKAVTALPSGQVRVRLAPESAAVLVPLLGRSLRSRPLRGNSRTLRTPTLSHATL